MHHPLDHLEDLLDEAADLLRQAQRVTVLTGAGISAESGVPTFRGSDGLWEGHRITEVATPEGFEADPDLVWRFYNQRRAGLLNVSPNPGHRVLVEMERRWAERFSLITQNVDGLHRRAGSSRVFEVHGRLSHVRCTKCPYAADRGLETLPDLPKCPACGALLRPDIVWFGEHLPQNIWDAAEKASENCSCFLVIGTSAVVYPAAGLIRLAKKAGASVIEVNLERTAASYQADVSLLGRSGELLPQVFERLGEGQR
jgi:NAD-dependent deacetylase